MRQHPVAAPKTFVLLLAIALTPSSAHALADTYPRQPVVDAEHYVFRLTLLTTDSNEIEGEATVRLLMAADGVTDALLDLASATADGKGMTVTRVTSNGQPVRFTHEHNRRLRLPLPARVKAGDDVTFEIAYHGVPANGLRLLNNIHGERTAFSENWFHNARQWLPTIDHIADKATAEFIVTTKAEYQVISNGLLMDKVDLPGSLRRTHWSKGVAVSPWLYSLGIAHFVAHYEAPVKGIQLSFWAFPQDTGKGLKALQRDARGAFEFFSEKVGPYAYDKLAHVEAAGMGGGTEHATNIFYGEKGVTAGNAPVVHETAHQWFGNAVTESDWNDVWLSEGFATYFTLLYTEHAAGRDAFLDGLRRSRDRVLQLEKTLPNTPVVHVNFDESKPAGPNNQLVYQKGGWTLHMLRDQIGTDAFWRGIRLYYQAHMNGLASTGDLRRAMEQASGQDLSWFFNQWLTRSGVPSVQGTWRYDAAARQIIVTIRQAQAADPYRFQMGIGVIQTAGAVPRAVEAQVTGRETRSRSRATRRPRLSSSIRTWRCWPTSGNRRRADNDDSAPRERQQSGEYDEHEQVCWRVGASGRGGPFLVVLAPGRACAIRTTDAQRPKVRGRSLLAEATARALGDGRTRRRLRGCERPRLRPVAPQPLPGHRRDRTAGAAGDGVRPDRQRRQLVGQSPGDGGCAARMFLRCPRQHLDRR
jgi:aminopeptidase N